MSKLSEEEIIKEIEIIKEAQDIMQHNLDIYPSKEDIYRLDTKQLKAVICLLDLYQKEKEKNKELEKDISEMYYKGVVLDILQDELNISRDEAIEILENH